MLTILLAVAHSGEKVAMVVSSPPPPLFFDQKDNEPVSCVSWQDAQAFVAWLSHKTGQRYRLLSEAEWEYAARAGTKTLRYWGDDKNNEEACTFANVSDISDFEVRHLIFKRSMVFYCRDDAPRSAAVGQYRPNAFGLYDMLGNVAELVADCWSNTYPLLYLDGRAVGDQKSTCSRVYRGGSWYNTPMLVRAADRMAQKPDHRSFSVGFRVARDLK